MSRLDDPEDVARQYARPENFDARVRLYRRYARRRPSWLEWLFDHVAPHAGDRILDVGCGTGNLWAENADRLPARVAPTLLDRSTGMLGAARERLASCPGPFHYQRADARALPFRDAAFDVVVANHMLYHVAERDRAIAELGRVLAPGGRCCVGTNDRTHLRELRELVEDFGVESTMARTGRESAAFDLETAAQELAPAFASVRIARRSERLRVDEAEVVGDYLRSVCPDDPDNLARIRALQRHVDLRIRRGGAFEITVAAGACLAGAARVRGTRGAVA